MTTHTARTYGLIALAAKVALGATMALGLGGLPIAAADHGETVQLRQPVVQVSEQDVMSDGSVFVTDQNGDTHHRMLDNGVWRDVTESDTEWSCVDDGNRVCGPGNAEGKPAACYDQGGVIVAVWPCQSTVNADGSQDVDFDADDVAPKPIVTLAAWQDKGHHKH